jgi:guanylate kinase
VPFAITISGPSGSGKSTVLQHIQDIGQRFGIRARVVNRYTTRERRSDDGDDLETVEQIPRICDLVYEQYGDRYGLQSRSFFDCLARGETPIVIVNDIRTVADVKTTLGPLTRTLFVFRSSPRLDGHIKLAHARAVENPEADAERRFAKASALYRIYIENIHLFDHVLVNAGTIGDLHHQVEVVVRGFGGTVKAWPLGVAASALESE